MKELAHEQELAHSNLAGVGWAGWGGMILIIRGPDNAQKRPSNKILRFVSGDSCLTHFGLAACNPQPPPSPLSVRALFGPV